MLTERFARQTFIVTLLLGAQLLLVDEANAVGDFDSLYTQIETANRNGAGTIALSGDVTLDGPLPPITGEVTLDGGGHSISGENKYRIFDIAGGTLNLTDVTLTRGQADRGGAIRVLEGASVSAERVTFTWNLATNGGAIATVAADARATISGSIFSANRSDEWGGAIQAMYGAVTISGSSFVGNAAKFFGGALHSLYGSFDVTNSTFKSNTAVGGGAVSVDYGETALTHVTMINNAATQLDGDAIYSLKALVSLRNSIVDSRRGEAPDCVVELAQKVGNLSSDGTCASSPSNDPRLDELTGSPAHYPLLDFSPALNAADPEFCLPIDQIGTERPHGGGCDIGAYESTTATPGPAPIVPPPPCYLTLEIMASNSDAPVGGCPAGNGHDTISLTKDVLLDTRLPAIKDGLTIEGNGFTISGAGRFPIFFVRGVRLEINNLTITQGYSPRTPGGAIHMWDDSTVVVSNSRFTNSLGLSGGAIASLGRNNELSISNSVFSGNIATNSGGAIYSNRGSTLIEGSSFISNRGRSGGAVHIVSGVALNIANSTFSNNVASHSGGALEVGHLDVTLTHLTMMNNRTEGRQAEDEGHTININQGSSSIGLRNSIIGGGGEGPDCAGALTQNIGNLIEDGSCSPKLSGDPMLDELTGSPAWHPLQPGSPAIHAGEPEFCLPADQSGTRRPLDGGCDIGAIEMPPVVTALSACSVTTTHSLNLRDGPSGERIGLVPANASLAASVRTAGWFNVEHDGAPGWISADYVVVEGDCG